MRTTDVNFQQIQEMNMSKHQNFVRFIIFKESGSISKTAVPKLHITRAWPPVPECIGVSKHRKQKKKKKERKKMHKKALKYSKRPKLSLDGIFGIYYYIIHVITSLF